jgi:predicted acylesterase/phospholipase RssA
VLRALAARRRAGSQPGARRDGFRIALAIEGGGMRGVISAGMALELAELDLVSAFDAVYGASAGAITGAWLLSRPEGLLGWAEPAYAKTLIRRSALLRGRAVVDIRALIEDLYQTTFPMDFAAVLANPIELHPLATDAATGRSTDLRPFIATPAELRLALRASAAMPLLAGPPVEFAGRRFYDAGVSESVPYRTALAQGATHVLVLRSRRAPRPAPDVIASVGLAPVGLTSVGLAPVGLAPDSLAPDSLAPDSLAPDSLAPDSLAPDSLAPDSLAPDSLALDGLALDGPGSDGPGSAGPVPDGLASNGPGSAGPAPDGFALDALAPDGLALDGLASDGPGSTDPGSYALAPEGRRPSRSARLLARTTLRRETSALRAAFLARESRLAADDQLLAQYESASRIPPAGPASAASPASARTPAVLSIRPAPDSPVVSRLGVDGALLRAALEAGRAAARNALGP